MEINQAEEAIDALKSAVCHIKWRLKPSSKRRLEIDLLALCSRMRPVVMVDYGGKMPELQDHLCSLLEFLHKESTLFEHLRVMVIDDMIYLVNVREFADYITWSLSPDAKQFFVDLEHDPPMMISAVEESSALKELVSFQQFLSSVITPDGVCTDALRLQNEDKVLYAKSSSADLSDFSKVLDLSTCIQDHEITIPTLNGWLLGYPVIYLFGKEHISDAVYNLSTKSLRLFKILFSRSVSGSNPPPLEELMSFTVPYDLSAKGGHEPWAQAFWLQVQLKHKNCKQVWRSLQMEVTKSYPQAIAL